MLHIMWWREIIEKRWSKLTTKYVQTMMAIVSSVLWLNIAKVIVNRRAFPYLAISFFVYLFTVFSIVSFFMVNKDDPNVRCISTLCYCWKHRRRTTQTLANVTNLMSPQMWRLMSEMARQFHWDVWWWTNQCMKIMPRCTVEFYRLRRHLLC